MKATYWQRGETLDYTPEEDIEAGTVLNIGGRIGVAAANIPAGQLGHVHVVGVFWMDKAEGQAVEMGVAVYFSEADETVGTVAEGNVPAGYAAASAKAEDASVLVKLPG